MKTAALSFAAFIAVATLAVRRPTTDGQVVGDSSQLDDSDDDDATETSASTCVGVGVAQRELACLWPGVPQ